DQHPGQEHAYGPRAWLRTTAAAAAAASTRCSLFRRRRGPRTAEFAGGLSAERTAGSPVPARDDRSGATETASDQGGQQADGDEPRGGGLQVLHLALLGVQGVPRDRHRTDVHRKQDQET